ncbi:Zinc finger CCCH domain-containing protein 49 [Raphanus sativus]|uniref:Zinc finger CCCH domain-containing protein 49 n=1 Tax=Raphanus sativus TaxID=3726 RepID=A0A6J0KJH5_RAPSA|nr:zinc finger CCCH domain-containing protein 49 [Raphanus sativus]KAJ4880505.1 Zinc finger CCCH domain-containing protein 49 [Raphanus sativus]
MIGETHEPYPTVQIPTWPVSEYLTSSEIFSPAMNSPDFSTLEALTALHRYLPSNEPDPDSDPEPPFGPDSPVDAYSSDRFRMYDFKVLRCARGRSHDWTECPYVHPGEKARRRDPAKCSYSGTACPEFRKGSCKKGDSCEFAHGVFECWLHPSRYRTQPCKDGGGCRRKVCFFAHSPEQLRYVQARSPDRVDSCFRAFQLSVSPVSSSPPVSPRADSECSQSLSRSLGSSYINEVTTSFRNLQLERLKSFPPYYSNPFRCYQSGFGSPRGSMLGPGFQSLPTTPTRPGNLDIWEIGLEEEPAMERVVDSGRQLRAKMFEKLSKENCMDRVKPDQNSGEAPDVRWVSELVM